MTTSAIEPGRREARKRETERRIRDCALVLTDERGLDGWTMYELAEAADVSRRTLFNYFPGKVDAVLGTVPDLPADALKTFHGGGPTGRLVDDLLALAEAVLAEESFDPAGIATERRVLTANARLLVVAHERFEAIMQEMGDHILVREGDGFGSTRARLLIRVLVSVFDASLQQLLDAPDGRLLAQLFDHNVRQARDLLA